MTSNPPPGYPRVTPYLLDEDAGAAIDYLQRTFGFELRLAQVGAAGRSHNELLLGEEGLEGQVWVLAQRSAPTEE